MFLSEPYLKVRATKAMPQMNPVLGDIDESFFIANHINFHFGMKENEEINYAWKVLLSDVSIEKVDDENIKNAVLSHISYNHLFADFTYLQKHNLQYQIIIFNDNVDWKKENNFIAIISMQIKTEGFFKKTQKLELSVEKLSQKEFQNRLVQIFGINRTAKPLINSTTEFEGYLSDVSRVGSYRNDVTLFPGDADLVLYKPDTFGSLALIEFKKHTIKGYGRIEDQSYMKYNYKDNKKYTGLSKIAKRLNLNYFYNVIYSTKPEEYHKLKIEKIDVNLNLIESKMFSFTDKKDLLAKMKGYIK